MLLINFIPLLEINLKLFFQTEAFGAAILLVRGVWRELS